MRVLSEQLITALIIHIVRHRNVNTVQKLNECLWYEVGSVVQQTPCQLITADDVSEKTISSTRKVKGKVHPCTGTEALYRPYGP